MKIARWFSSERRSQPQKVFMKSFFVSVPLLSALMISGCRDFQHSSQSDTYAEESENCSGSFEKLDLDCLLEVFKKLPDTEIIRNLQMLSKKNLVLKQTLVRTAENEIPEWAKNRIKQKIQQGVLSGGPSNQKKRITDQTSSSRERYEDEVIRHYIEFVRLLNSKSSIDRSPETDQASLWKPLAHFGGEKETYYDLSSNRDALSLIGEHQFVYQRKDGKIVGIDLTTGSEVFSYDIGKNRVTAFAALNDHSFLAAYMDDPAGAGPTPIVSLWPTKPSTTTQNQKPLKVFKPRSKGKLHNGDISLIIMNADTFIALFNHDAEAFSTSGSVAPIASLSGNFIKYRLKKNNADELFVAPDGPLSAWAPEFWNIRTNKTTKKELIPLPEKASYRFEVAAPNKILYAKDGVCQYRWEVHLYHKDQNSTENLGTFNDRWLQLSHDTFEISGNIYRFAHSNKPVVENIRKPLFHQISRDVYLGGWGDRYPILSWNKSLQPIGSAEILMDRGQRFSIFKTSDKGELILTDNHSIKVVNLWSNIAQKLSP